MSEIGDLSRVLAPPRRLLMGPGPSNVSPRVYRALGEGLVGHLDPEFLGLMDRLQARLHAEAAIRTAPARTAAVLSSSLAGLLHSSPMEQFGVDRDAGAPDVMPDTDPARAPAEAPPVMSDS